MASRKPAANRPQPKPAATEYVSARAAWVALGSHADYEPKKDPDGYASGAVLYRLNREGKLRCV